MTEVGTAIRPPAFFLSFIPLSSIFLLQRLTYRVLAAERPPRMRCHAKVTKDGSSWLVEIGKMP
jgi:hypothetical protein